MCVCVCACVFVFMCVCVCLWGISRHLCVHDHVISVYIGAFNPDNVHDARKMKSSDTPSYDKINEETKESDNKQ